MKIITIFFLAIISNVLFGQLSGDIGIGYNRFTNNYNDYKRTDGLTLQFSLEKPITDLFSVNYGLSLSIAHENYINYTYYAGIDSTGYIIYDYSHIKIDKSNNYSLNLQLPVVLVTNIISDKIYILSGISLNYDNIIVFGDGFSTVDPEATGFKPVKEYYSHEWPVGGLGFGHQIGLLYKPVKKLGISAEWKTTKNSTFCFSYLEIGVRYKVFDKSKK